MIFDFSDCEYWYEYVIAISVTILLFAGCLVAELLIGFAVSEFVIRLCDFLGWEIDAALTRTAIISVAFLSFCLPRQRK